MYAPGWTSMPSSHQRWGSWMAKYDRRWRVSQPPMPLSCWRTKSRRNAVRPSYQSWLPGTA